LGFGIWPARHARPVRLARLGKRAGTSGQGLRIWNFRPGASEFRRFKGLGFRGSGFRGSEVQGSEVQRFCSSLFNL